jgi:hypothetical protein
MKTQLRSIALLFFSLVIFSTISFAQPPPGGQDDGSPGGGPDGGGNTGGGGTSCPVSYSFKRNNGNGWGVCHGDAQIRVSFNPMPTAAMVPVLTAIYYQGKALTNVMLPVEGDLVTKGQSYVSYCLTGSAPAKNNGNPFGNIPPGVKLLLEFTYPNGMICKTESDVPN